MYLIDTNVISESRKGPKADRGVKAFFDAVIRDRVPVFLSVVTIGELRRGIDLIRHRGDQPQAKILARWFASILDRYEDYILEIDADVAQVWGRLRVPHPENALDKLVAATALVHDLAVVTRNDKHFHSTGARVTNPFSHAEKP